MRLPLGLTEDALRDAMLEEDPESLAAAARMRAEYGPKLAAAALTQATLRWRATTKFGHDEGHTLRHQAGHKSHVT